MEFYANYSSGILAATEGFNSQRDGILRPLFALSLLHEAVSIPNGMEFYQKGSKNDRTRISFQFPTGWNSTNLSSNTATADTVSIPNGMEFYRSKSFAMMRRLRFNSQRDGILPFFTFFLCTQASFNSQRDGILLKVADRIVVYLDVSIPNGMEFYIKIFFIGYSLNKVSIPNGMEFYIVILWLLFRPNCFNSQRDGILLR